MRVAALYDIHGNLPALEAVLAEVVEAGVDRLVVGGDVLPGPMVRETLAALREVDAPLECLYGNGERDVLAVLEGGDALHVPERFRGSLRWAAEQLRPEDVSWLSCWSATLELEIAGLGKVLFCHATPRNDREIFTRLTSSERLLPVFASVDAPTVVCGHTHMQFDRSVSATRVVNAGSVGMPFGEPVACWALLGPGVELRSTSYDLASAARRVRETEYPQAEEFAEDNVLAPPSESAMLELFEGAALR